MKELYNEYFHIPKNGKIRDKVMLIQTAITAIVMIICLAAMSFTAYAYFSYNVTSGSNIIRAANFEADVSISRIVNDSSTPVDVVKTENGTQEAKLNANATYTVTITPGESTAKTGFCVITAENCTNTYHTQQLGTDKSVEGGETPSITFTLTVSNDTTVKILSHWGTSSYYDPYKNDTRNAERYILNGDVVNIAVADAADSNSGLDEEKEATSDETTAIETTPAETTPAETTPAETTATETTPAEVIHTVASGENLTRIASQYDTTVARIVAYNNLPDKNNIMIGQLLKIPPVDWEISADTTDQTATATPETTDPETTTTSETTTPTETTVTDPAETTGTYNEGETTDGGEAE